MPQRRAPTDLRVPRAGDYEAGLAFNRIYSAVTPSLAHWKEKVPSGAKRDYLERQAVAPVER